MHSAALPERPEDRKIASRRSAPISAYWFPALDACAWFPRCGLGRNRNAAVRYLAAVRPGAPHLLQPGHARTANGHLTLCCLASCPDLLSLSLQSRSFACLTFHSACYSNTVSLLTEWKAPQPQNLPVTKTCSRVGGAVCYQPYAPVIFVIHPSRRYFFLENRRMFPRRSSRRMPDPSPAGIDRSRVPRRLAAVEQDTAGGVKSLSVLRLIALGGEGSRPAALNLVSFDDSSATHRPILLLQLRILADPSRKIFPLPLRSASCKERVRLRW